MKKSVESGQLLVGNPRQIVTGIRLAEILDLKPGDLVMLMAQTLQGSLNLIELEFAGTKKAESSTNATHMSAHCVEMPLAAAQKLLNMPDRVSQLVVRLENPRNAPGLSGQIQKALNENGGPLFRVRDYASIIPGFGVNTLFRYIGLLVGAVFFLVIGAGIANVMYMSVMERRKEIGTMKAIGMEQREIRRLFLMEGGFLAIGGILIGLFSFLFILATNLLDGLPISFAFSETEPDQVLLSIDCGVLWASRIITFLACLAAACFPSAYSARLKPVDILREE
jgi:putative ABC transport system permease protein